MSYYGIEQMKNRMTGGSYPAITSTELKDLKIPLPPIIHQKSIANKLLELRNQQINLIRRSEKSQEEAIKEFEYAIFIH